MAEKQPEFEESGRYPFDDMEEPAQSPVSAVRNAALIEEIVLDCTASEREIYFAHLRQIAEQEPEIYRRLQIYEKEEPKPSRQDRATMNRIDAKIMRRLYRQHMEYSQIMRCISYSPAYKTLSAEFRWILASTRVAREINPILLSPDLVSAEPIYRIDRKTIRDEPDKAYCSYLKAVLEQKPSMDLKEADEKIAEALRRMHIPDAEIRQCMSYSVGKEQEEAPREQYQFVQIRNPEKLTQKRLEDCLKTLHTGKPSPEVELAAGKLILEVRGLNEARRQDISTQSENLKLWQCFNVYVEQLEACKENLSNGPKIIQALKEAQEYLSAQKNELLRFFPKYQQELAERDSRQKPAEIFRKIEKEGIDPKAEPNLTPPQRKIEPLAQERPQPEEESKDQDLYQAMQKTIRGMEKTDLAAYWKQVHQTIEQTMLAVNQAKIAYKVLAIWEIGLEKSCKDFHMDMDQNLKELSQKLRQTLQNEEERWQLICQMAGKASQFSEKLMAFAKLEQSAPQLTREEFLHAKKFAKLQPSAPARELYYAAVGAGAAQKPAPREN